MVSVAWANLRDERGRLAAGVAGVAVSVLLVLFLFGVYFGFLVSMTRFVDDAGADIWVTQAETADMFHSLSVMPIGLEANLSAVDGVESATPLYARALHAHVGPQEATLFVVGFDPATGIGGPGRVRSGTVDIEEDEVLVSRVFAKEEGVGLGDTIHLATRDFTVAGITDQGSASVFSFAYIQRSAAEETIGLPGVVQYFLVNIERGARVGDVIDEIHRDVDGVTAYSSDDFAEVNAEGIKDTFDPILLSVSVMGALVGAAVIALTCFGTARQRLGEYGVLKAMGAPIRLLSRAVTLQGVVTGLVGLIIGWPLYEIVSRLLVEAIPRLPFALPLHIVAYVFVAVLVICVLSSLLPVRLIRRLDPADVLRRAG